MDGEWVVNSVGYFYLLGSFYTLCFPGAYSCGARDIATEYLDKYSATRLLGDHVPYAVEAWPEETKGICPQKVLCIVAL